MPTKAKPVKKKLILGEKTECGAWDAYRTASPALTKPEKDLLISKKVASKLISPPKKERAKPSAENSTLPLVSVLCDSDMVKRAGQLLTIAFKLKSTKDQAEKDIKECKEELAAMAMGHELPGLRYGQLAIQVSGYKSRKTFDVEKAKQLMLNAGVDPTEIGECYKEGEEYLDTRLVELSA